MVATLLALTSFQYYKVLFSATSPANLNPKDQR